MIEVPGIGKEINPKREEGKAVNIIIMEQSSSDVGQFSQQEEGERGGEQTRFSNLDYFAHLQHNHFQGGHNPAK